MRPVDLLRKRSETRSVMQQITKPAGTNLLNLFPKPLPHGSQGLVLESMGVELLSRFASYTFLHIELSRVSWRDDAGHVRSYLRPLAPKLGFAFYALFLNKESL